MLSQPLPANAAVPKTKPTRTFACDGGEVRLWTAGKHLAVKNTCKATWFTFTTRPWDNGGSKAHPYNVAPGAHLNWRGWDWKRLNHEGERQVTFTLNDQPIGACWPDGADVILRGSQGKSTPLPCPGDE